MAHKSTAKDALTSALHILTLREHTAFELAQKLRLKDFDEAEIAAALEQCRAWNYLDDERAARVLAKTLLRKGAGLNKIKFELSKRKVPAAVAAMVVEELNIGEGQLDAALKLVAKKFVKADNAADKHKQKGKIYRYLQGKGYTADIIFKVFENFYNP